MIASHVFDELFVLEMANNHWGSLERGLKIVKDFGRIVRFNNVKAAIKVQLRDVDTFIHEGFSAIGATSATSPRRSTRNCRTPISSPWCRPSARPAASRRPRRSTRPPSILRRAGRPGPENRQLRH